MGDEGGAVEEAGERLVAKVEAAGARRTLEHDEHMRAQRNPAAPTVRASAAARSLPTRDDGAGPLRTICDAKHSEKLPGAVMSRAIPLSVRGDAQTAVSVFVPRTDGESVPVTIGPEGVTITRGATTVTTPLP